MLEKELAKWVRVADASGVLLTLCLQQQSAIVQVISSGETPCLSI